MRLVVRQLQEDSPPPFFWVGGGGFQHNPVLVSLIQGYKSCHSGSTCKPVVQKTQKGAINNQLVASLRWILHILKTFCLFSGFSVGWKNLFLLGHVRFKELKNSTMCSPHRTEPSDIQSEKMTFVCFFFKNSIAVP